jgi:lipopolysaccharide export system protein LptA
VLEYDGASGRAVYRGQAALWQNQTALRGETMTIDQQSGDLVVAGAARSDLSLETGRGRAAEIRYDDETRTIEYLSHRPSAGGGAAVSLSPPAARGRGADPLPQAQMSGPQGDLQADRIEVVLAPKASRAERVEAYGGVSSQIDTRVATADRLTYFAADERYVLSSTGTVPVKVVDGCRETTGRTLTFFKTADRILVDGNEQIRTQTKTGGPCTAPAAPPAR